MVYKDVKMHSNTMQIEYTADGDALLIIPDDVLDKLGWDVGDTLTWTLHDDDTVSITK
jgi:hypothetical protein